MLHGNKEIVLGFFCSEINKDSLLQHRTKEKNEVKWNFTPLQQTWLLLKKINSEVNEVIGCPIDSTEVHKFLSKRRVAMFDCNNLTTVLMTDFFYIAL